MHTAIAKNTLSVGPRVALLATLASLAMPVSDALAETGGASATTPATPTSTPATSSDETSSGGAAPTLATPGKLTLATWFGPGFYGHKTACGQTMSTKLVGVASRKLPCGTLVQIGYRGHELTVPVLDRGPYGDSGAAWDLTAAAAKALNIKQTVRITTEIVGSTPNSPSLGEPAEALLPAAPTTTSSGASTSEGSATLETSAAAAKTGGASAG
jgi:rare lipoprotein A (peptidoglycan hydrolase)